MTDNPEIKMTDDPLVKMTGNPIVKIIEECPPFPGVKVLREKTENQGFTFEDCIDPKLEVGGIDVFLHDVVAEGFFDFMGTIDFEPLMSEEIDKEFKSRPEVPSDEEDMLVRRKQLTRGAFTAWFQVHELPEHLLEQGWETFWSY